MFRRWTLMFVAATLLAGGAFVGGTIIPRQVVEGRDVPELHAPMVRLAYVNIAEVLKTYQRALQLGESINQKRKIYTDQVNALRAEHGKLAQTLPGEADDKEKIKTQEKITAVARKIEDLDKTAQRELTALSDKVIVDIYNDISNCVAELAKERSLDAVEIYPAAKPVTSVTARLMLQAPACYPIYLRKELDMTEDLIKRLNQKHPGEK